MSRKRSASRDSGFPFPVVEIDGQPDWIRHAKAAPFKRNDAMLASLPIGVMVFAGTGIQDDFVDKVRRRGIPVGSSQDGA